MAEEGGKSMERREGRTREGRALLERMGWSWRLWEKLTEGEHEEGEIVKREWREDMCGRHVEQLCDLLRFAHGAVRIDGGRSLRLYPAGKAAQVNVFDRPGALARINERVVHVPGLIADVALRRKPLVLIAVLVRKANNLLVNG